jgi:hypothetical protein
MLMLGRITMVRMLWSSSSLMLIITMILGLAPLPAALASHHAASAAGADHGFSIVDYLYGLVLYCLPFGACYFYHKLHLGPRRIPGHRLH